MFTSPKRALTTMFGGLAGFTLTTTCSNHPDHMHSGDPPHGVSGYSHTDRLGHVADRQRVLRHSKNFRSRFDVPSPRAIAMDDIWFRRPSPSYVLEGD